MILCTRNRGVYASVRLCKREPVPPDFSNSGKSGRMSTVLRGVELQYVLMYLLEINK